MKKPKPAESNTGAGAGSDEMAHDEASAASGTSAPAALDKPPAQSGGDTASKQQPAAYLTLGWPLPKDLPEKALEGAELVVAAKSKDGRRRAGRSFAFAEATVIPLAELKAEEIASITDDQQLVVSVRVHQPS